MPNAQDKAWLWTCNDASDGETKLDQLACRFRTVEDANDFKAKMEAAQIYNQNSKAGKEVIMADTVEDIEEAVVDDIDTNKTADPDAEAD